MGPRVYQNGAIWDWWGGRQITGEFKSGYAAIARDHLFTVARDWTTHPGAIREWESPWLRREGLENSYAGAAGVMGQAVVQGLFGLILKSDALEIVPGLGPHNGEIRIHQPAGNRYAAYQYRVRDGAITLDYGTNADGPVLLRLTPTWRGDATALFDETAFLPIEWELQGNERRAVLRVPTGMHRVELRMAQDQPDLLPEEYVDTISA
jgi:hypothetical protein